MMEKIIKEQLEKIEYLQVENEFLHSQLDEKRQIIKDLQVTIKALQTHLNLVS